MGTLLAASCVVTGPEEDATEADDTEDFCPPRGAAEDATVEALDWVSLAAPFAESLESALAAPGAPESGVSFAVPDEAVFATNGSARYEASEAPATGAAAAAAASLATDCGWAVPAVDTEDEGATEARNEELVDSEPPLREAAGCLMVVGPVAAGCRIELSGGATSKVRVLNGDGRELALEAGSSGFEGTFEATFGATVGAAFGATSDAATTEAEAFRDAGTAAAGADNDATAIVDENADAGDAGSESR